MTNGRYQFALRDLIWLVVAASVVFAVARFAGVRAVAPLAAVSLVWCAKRALDQAGVRTSGNWIAAALAAGPIFVVLLWLVWLLLG